MTSFRFSLEETGQKNMDLLQVSDKHFHIELYQAHHTMEKESIIFKWYAV